MPTVKVIDACGPNNAIYGAVPEGNYTYVRNADGSITLTPAPDYAFPAGTVTTLPAPTDSNLSCVVHPTINKVDQDGKLLPGATFEGYHCTRYDNDTYFRSCEFLIDYEWFTDRLPSTGTTGETDFSVEETDATSCASSTVFDLLIIREVTAPAGYKGISGWSVYCHTVNGWVADSTAELLTGLSDTPLLTSAQPGVSSDGTTITFRNDLIGKGGVDPTPITPTPVKPAVPGILPIELPRTGPTEAGSTKGLFLALIAAIATYGAVYFAQGKRRYDTQ